MHNVLGEIYGISTFREYLQMLQYLVDTFCMILTKSVPHGYSWRIQWWAKLIHPTLWGLFGRFWSDRASGWKIVGKNLRRNVTLRGNSATLKVKDQPQSVGWESSAHRWIRKDRDVPAHFELMSCDKHATIFHFCENQAKTSSPEHKSKENHLRTTSSNRTANFWK